MCENYTISFGIFNIQLLRVTLKKLTPPRCMPVYSITNTQLQEGTLVYTYSSTVPTSFQTCPNRKCFRAGVGSGKNTRQVSSHANIFQLLVFFACHFNSKLALVNGFYSSHNTYT